MKLSRREFVGMAGGAGAAAMLGLFPERATGHPNPPANMDAITHRCYDGIKSWTDWLRRNGAKGYLCETGWPNNNDGPRSDINQWNTLGNKIYLWLDAADVWATYWTATSAQGPNVGPAGTIWQAYGPSDYSVPYAERVIDTAYEQTAVIEAHPSTARYKRGVNTNGGELRLGMEGVDNLFSNENPGVYGQNYAYPTSGSLQYLARRGHKVIRLPFRWERIQPTIRGGLKQAELVRIKNCVAAAHAAGLRVILDPHNWAGYTLASGPGKTKRLSIGSPGLPIPAFADLWRRLAGQFKDNPGIDGYQLMNEPYGMPGGPSQWEQASREAVRGIRSTGDQKRLMVTGYFKSDSVPYSGVFGFTAHHPRPWITDPANKVWYTTHGYWGRFSYTELYNDTNNYWKTQGF